MTAYRQLATIREIEELGGDVHSDRVGPKWLRDLAGEEWMRAFDEVTTVVLKDASWTDSTLSRISSLRYIKALWLRDTQVTDAGLAHLRHLDRLECLNLSKSKVSAAGLQNLVTLTHLKVLWLDDSQADDAGRKHIKKLAGLKWLVVDKPAAPDRFGELRVLFIRMLELNWRDADATSLEEVLAIGDRALMPQLVIRRLSGALEEPDLAM